MTITNNIITIPITNDIKTKTILTDLAGSGHTGVQAAGCPAPVPGTGGHQLGVLVAIRALEVAEGPAGEENLRGEDELPVPLPGAAGGALGGLRAVDS